LPNQSGFFLLKEKIFLFFSKVARKMNKELVANRSDFAAVPIEGFIQRG
jgi:hypothetical protein